MKATGHWALAIHGGAGGIPRGSAAELDALSAALHAALEAGAAVLRGGGCSLDAAQRAVHSMEDSGLLNAGRGAVLNAAGFAELDAALMDGRNKAAGAVAAVRHVPNPIDLARKVMDDGRHVLLVAEGAEQFAQRCGMGLVASDYFITERRRQELARVQGSAVDPVPSWFSLGTVGAVALDAHGDLAAATSTGGLTNKSVGRVGDSPVIGAGTYAENGVCAVSATGPGEYFLRHAAAYDVCARIKYAGEDCASAAEAVIRTLAARGGEGGLIALDAAGRISIPFATPTMLRGCISAADAAQVWLDPGSSPA